MTGWPWPLDGAQEWFEGLWNWISDVATSLYTDVESYLLGMWNNIVEHVELAAQAVETTLTPLINGVNDFVSSSVEWVVTSLVGSIKQVKTWLEDTGDTIFTAVKPYFGELGTAFNDTINWLYLSIKPTLTEISDAVGGVAEATKKSLMEVLDPAITGFSEKVNEILTGMGAGFAMGLKTFWNWLASSMRDTVDLLTDGIAWATDVLKGKFTGVVTTLTNEIAGFFAAGSPPPEIHESMTGLVEKIQSQILTNIEQIKTHSIDIDEVVRTGTTTAIGLLGAAGGAFTIAMAADASNLMKDWGAKDMVKSVIALTGLGGVIAPIFTIPYRVGMLRSLEYYYNKLYEPMQPSMSQLITLRIKDLIDEETFALQSRYQGFAPEWSAAFLESSYSLPSLGQAFEMVNRGLISEEQLTLLMQHSGINPEWHPYLSQLRFALPSISDLIRFRVREVIGATDYDTYLEQRGFLEPFRTWHWDAHFVLPSFLRLREAWWRGAITEEQFRKYIFWHDYQDTPRPDQEKSDVDIMLEVSKNILTDVDLRRGWRVNEVTDEELLEGIKKQGFFDEDARKLAVIQKALALESDINSVISSTISDFKEGFIDEGTLRDNLAALKMRPVMVDYNVQRAKIDRRRALDKKKISTYLRGFRAGTVTEEDLRSKLIALGLASDWVRALIEYETITREVAVVDVTEEARRLTKTDILSSFKKGIIDESTARDKLEDMGYPAEDTNVLIELNRPAAVGA